MANNFMVNVPKSFDLGEMTNRVVETYQSRGFNVRTLKMKNGVKITVEKNVGGINTLLGLGQGITATCTIYGKDRDNLSVNLSDGDWMGKIVGLVVGWFFCLVPAITAVVGILKQTTLQKDFSNDIQMLACEQED